MHAMSVKALMFLVHPMNAEALGSIFLVHPMNAEALTCFSLVHLKCAGALRFEMPFSF